MRTNRWRSTKIQTTPSLILHQRNILHNNQLLQNRHPCSATIPLPSASFHFEGPMSALSRKSSFFLCQNCFTPSVQPFTSPFSCTTNLWSASSLGSTSLIKTDSCCLGWVWLQWESNIWVHWLTRNLLFNSSPISCRISIKKEALWQKEKLYLHDLIRYVLITAWPTVSLPTCKLYNYRVSNRTESYFHPLAVFENWIQFCRNSRSTKWKYANPKTYYEKSVFFLWTPS